MLTPVDNPLEREADHAARAIMSNKSIAATGRVAPMTDGSLPAAARAISQGGVPLTADQRAYFEPRFGHDFSDVRLHTHGAAKQAARGIKARAYTHGHDIAFSKGGYDTGLLAHELTHVVQQRGGDGGQPLSSTSHEVEADQAASAITAGRGVSPITHRATVGIARQPARSSDESDEEVARRRALASLDWLEAYPPVIFDDNAPVLIAWAERQAEKYFDPDASDERRAAIAAGLLKVYESLRQFERRAKRAPDGALLYANVLRERDTPWSADRPHALAEVSPFTPESIAEWRQVSKSAKNVVRGRKSAKTAALPKKRQAMRESPPPSTAAVNVTFKKQRGMTLATPEGQRLIIAFLIASTRQGYTGDQINYIVSRLNLEKRWMPPAGTDLETWQQSFEVIPEGGEVTLTVDKSFTLELDNLLISVPSDRDFMLEGYRRGVLEAEAGLKLGIATFAVGTAALGGGALLGLALAPAAIGTGGLLGGGIGLSARTVGTHLYLNAPSLYGQTMLYSGAILSGAALGQHLLDVRARGSVGWHDIPRLAADLMPFASGYQDYRAFSGGGGGLRSQQSSDEPGETGIGRVRPPVERGKPDFIITRPARFDAASGKVKVGLVELSSKRALDGEIDPQTGNGQIVDRRSREVVGVISNGDIRRPSMGLPAPGKSGAPSSGAPGPAVKTPPVNVEQPAEAVGDTRALPPGGASPGGRGPAATGRLSLEESRRAIEAQIRDHPVLSGLANAPETSSAKLPPQVVASGALQEAQRRQDAAKAKYGSGSAMMMATPGPPASADRQLINQLTAKGTLTHVEMRGYIEAMMREHPVLRQLADAQRLTGPGQRDEMLRILHRAFREDGLAHEVVPDRTVQVATGERGNFASIHSKPGILQIEEAAYNSPAQLAAEVTHELCAFYIEITGSAGPTLGDYTANEALEVTVLVGGSFF